MKELVGHGLVVHERINHQKGSFWVGNLFFDNVWHLARYVSAHTLFLLSHMLVLVTAPIGGQFCFFFLVCHMLA